MNIVLSEFIRHFFDAVEAKDITAAMSCFNADAQFIDPHYPCTNMRGKEAIFDGLTWGFKSLKKFGFTIVNYFESEDGMSAAVEIATAHELPNGKKLNFPQVFIFEIRNEKINRLHAYEPYGPHGIVGFILGITRLLKKMKGLIRYS